MDPYEGSSANTNNDNITQDISDDMATLFLGYASQYRVQQHGLQQNQTRHQNPTAGQQFGGYQYNQPGFQGMSFGESSGSQTNNMFNPNFGYGQQFGSQTYSPQADWEYAVQMDQQDVDYNNYFAHQYDEGLRYNEENMYEHYQEGERAHDPHDDVEELIEMDQQAVAEEQNVAQECEDFFQWDDQDLDGMEDHDEDWHDIGGDDDGNVNGGEANAMEPIPFFDDRDRLGDDLTDMLNNYANSVVRYCCNRTPPSPERPRIPRPVGRPRHTSILTGSRWIHELLNGNPTTFYWQLRMRKTIFLELHHELVTKGGLESVTQSRVSTMESLAIFLRTVARGAKTRDSEHRFQHSTDTISRHNRKVLKALFEIAPLHIRGPDFNEIPPKISGESTFMPWFKVNNNVRNLTL